MQDQKGAVSIFVVVFSALFVTIITVSFVSLMIRAQQQASNADLSNSAYDSALAGVEDAKRVLLKYRQCVQDSTSHADCAALMNIFSTPGCNMVRQALTGQTDTGETLIQSKTEETISTGTSKKLDQAYTCVEVNYTADNKELQLGDGNSTLIPIDSNGTPFNALTLSWFMRTNTSPAFTLPDAGIGTSLPVRESWGVGTPPILRTQIIQHGASFNVDDFNTDQATGANVKTSFLFPFAGVGTTSLTPGQFDDRPANDAPVKGPNTVVCSKSRFDSDQYACIATIQLPDPVGGPGQRSLYLNLEPLYNNTKVKIELKNGTDPVNIVAPTIDSTGRANDLFRRVRVGVSFNGIYPRATFDINGNLCKNFAVTNDTLYDDSTCSVNP